MVVLWFIVLIGPLIFFHELGHFLFAKLFNVKVLKFSLGFGPAIQGLKWKWGETEYQVAWVPLGGYVKMAGDDPTEQSKPEDRGRGFLEAALWKRYLIVLAGPAFNLLLPVIIFFFAALGTTHLNESQIGTVVPGSAAAEAQLKPGDIILAVDGEDARYWDDFVDEIKDRPGKRTKLTIKRGPREFTVTVVPRARAVRNRVGFVEVRGFLGVGPVYPRAEVGLMGTGIPARKAGLRTGDRLIGIDGKPVETWNELEQRLARKGDQRRQVAYLRPGPATLRFLDLRIFEPRQATLPAGSAAELGLRSADRFVYHVDPGSDAAKVGLAPGDELLELDGKPIHSWDQMHTALIVKPDKTHQLAWRTPLGKRREGRIKVKKLVTIDEFKNKRTDYLIGFRNRITGYMPKKIFVPFGKRFTRALVQGPAKTWEICRQMIEGIGRIFTGSISADTIGGVIMLAHVANKAASFGWEAFIWIMALISINLALVNLLPIPVLDGGHIAIFTIEAVRRKPISTEARIIATYIGLVLLIALMVYAFRNDIVRFR